MAGTHEIWKLDLKAGKIGVWAGSGYENIEDGDLDTAKFAQPSGLATDGKNLFVADSEVSGVRVITGLNTDHPEVGRIVGQGLFKFGDIDGTGAEVRLQHCLGLAYGGGKLFIADTYNNKIKVCDPAHQTVKTFAGDGKPGSQDNPPRFYQPGGLSVAGDSLYVADTNNHKIRVIDHQVGSGQDTRDRWPRPCSFREGFHFPEPPDRNPDKCKTRQPPLIGGRRIAAIRLPSTRVASNVQNH